jgi:hypothetical protein
MSDVKKQIEDVNTGHKTQPNAPDSLKNPRQLKSKEDDAKVPVHTCL